MAYYNTTIWMATMLVILTSTATPTDDKMTFLNVRSLDGYLYGSSSAEITDNQEELSIQELIKENNYLQALNRGGFASPQIHITESDETDTVRKIVFIKAQEIYCNYTYDMLVFMKLMTPENYTNDELCKKVDSQCSNWARHMLNARINSGFPIRKSTYTLWLFYLYAKKMQMFAKRDAKKEMSNLHVYTEYHFTEQMEKCQYFWPKCDKYESYKDELASLDPDSALEKIIEACTHLSGISESKGNLNYDLDTSLYINNVVEDDVITNTLVTSFGGLNKGDGVVKALEHSMNAANDPMASLSDWIHSLGDVHNDFLWMVKIIMLRIWCAFLENLKTVENPRTAEQVKTLLYDQHLNDFADLFQLNDKDVFMKLIELYKKEDCCGLVDKMLLGYSCDNEERMSEKLRLLYKNDTEKSGFNFYSYISKTVNTVNCQTSTLVNIANGIGYKVDVRSSIRKSILCVEVFVEYLKKILSGVNFKILQSFVAFDQNVRQMPFLW